MAKFKFSPGFLYIMSIKGRTATIKIGKTTAIPEYRAKQLSKQKGSLGTYKVEWAALITHMDMAERALHFCFDKVHIDGELYKISVAKAKKEITKALAAFKTPYKLYDLAFMAAAAKPASAIKLKPLKKKRTTIYGAKGWNRFIKENKHAFIRKAVTLCFKRPVKEDFNSKTFPSYRTNWDGVKVIDLIFTENSIDVELKCSYMKAMQVIKDAFIKYSTHKIMPEYKTTKSGVRFSVTNAKNFEILKNWLDIGGFGNTDIFNDGVKYKRLGHERVVTIYPDDKYDRENKKRENERKRKAALLSKEKPKPFMM